VKLSDASFVAAAAVFALLVAGCGGRTTHDLTKPMVSAVPAPHVFDESDCVKRWNRLDYGSIVPLPEPTIPEVSVSVVSTADRVCAYEGPLRDESGNSFAYFLIVEGGDQSPESVKASEPILESDGPSQTYSPNHSIVNGKIGRLGASSPDAPTPTSTAAASVESCAARWNRLNYAEVTGTAAYQNDAVYVSVSDAATQVCEYEVDMSNPTLGSNYLSFSSTGSESEQQVSGDAATAFSTNPSATYSPAFFIDGTGRLRQGSPP
jgi:hypothetical protein